MKNLLTFMFALMALSIVTVCHAFAPPPPVLVVTVPVSYKTEMPVVAHPPQEFSYGVAPTYALHRVIPLTANYQFVATNVQPLGFGLSQTVTTNGVHAASIHTPLVLNNSNYLKAAEINISPAGNIQDDHPRLARNQTDPSLIKADEQKE